MFTAVASNATTMQQQQQQQQQQFVNGTDSRNDDVHRNVENHGQTGETQETTTPERTIVPEGKYEASGTAALADAKEPYQQPQTRIGASSETDTTLPSDLRKILEQVAETGSCHWLSWNHSSHQSNIGVGLDTGTTNGNPMPHTTPDGNSSTAPDTTRTTRPHPSTSASLYTAPTLLRPPTASMPASTAHLTAGHVRPTPLYPSASSSQPARKKPRNGLQASRPPPPQRRFDGTVAGSKTTTSTAGARKRPLFLIRTSSSASATSSIFSPGSVGSGRTSGSEPEDTSQYECDSEGTSATSNSEISMERRERNRRKTAALAANQLATTRINAPPAEAPPNLNYKSLREAMRTALGLVLDRWYKSRGGYKLSFAEQKRSRVSGNHTSSSMEKADSNTVPTTSGDNGKEGRSAEVIFQQRKHRLMNMLGPRLDSKDTESSKTPAENVPDDDGPPFTIQRIAEVLLAPERCYTQTHKLCNCLEKLLLVAASTRAFGGSTGGVTFQSQREERELAALGQEKNRLLSSFRQKRIRRRASSSSDDVHVERGEAAHGDRQGDADNSKVQKAQMLGSVADRMNGNAGDLEDLSGAVDCSEESVREMLEAAARASLRTKFDHVGIDPHSSALANRDPRSIAENRGMTNSPPPPNVSMATLPGHSTLLRNHTHSDQDLAHVARAPSPIRFSSLSETSSPPSMRTLHTNPNMHLLQINHAAALAGVSPFDLVALNGGTDGSGTISVGATAHVAASALKEADLESRSSASSDVDSESDDISLDDSASDRSDGSDSGHNEHLSAARAMALSRMQQQQRLQSRMQISLGNYHQSEGVRPPADSEYQSGDSIDSMRAEDSGGSDSSSSDVAD
jgi:hypothetical protein